MGTQEYIRHIKHEFMAYRNGIVAETLRKAGMGYKVIFGLQLPQLSSIARSVQKSSVLADSLWGDSEVRESRLLATMLFPEDEVSIEKAIGLARSVQTIEEADILCFKLLRRLPHARKIAETLLTESSPLSSYCGEALLRNLQ